MAKVIVHRHAVDKVDADGKVILNPKTKKALQDSTYWTKQDGKGTQASSVISAGGGLYYAVKMAGNDEPVITDAEKAEVKADAFKFAIGDTRRSGDLRKGKVHKTLDLLDSIKTTCETMSNRNGKAWTDEQAKTIMSLLSNKLEEVENALMSRTATQVVEL